MRVASAFMVSLFTLSAFAGEVAAGKFEALQEKPRLFVLTDLANEPDDEESLVRLLAYANKFDIEGIAATTSCHLRQNPREDILRRTIAAYGEAWTNLYVHAQGYPTFERLSAVAATGQRKFGLEGVGEPSPGSRLLAKSIRSDDPRPLWVSIWGGANTLLQALRDCRAEMKDGELSAALAKLRVCSISDQDDASPAARREFPSVTWIVDPSYPFDHRDYWKATWVGISGDVRGDGRKLNLPFVELVDNEWLKTHVMDVGPLGRCYPPHLYCMEGDTPSFLGLIANGLGWADSPAYGGWGGRYEWRTPEGESHPIWTTPEVKDELKGLRSPGYSIKRWREGYQLDFAGRMKWSVTPKYEDANHNPVAVLNGDRTKGVVRIAAKRGDKVALSAEGPYRDPIGKPLAVGASFIDPTVFVDDDGRAYLFWGNKGCWYGELNADMVSFKNGWREIPGFDDEKCFGPKSVRMNWAHGKEEPIVSYEEGPWVMKRNGTYYLSYAAGGVPEHMAYSTAPTINGPWTYRGKIMDTPHNSFTIHGGNIEFKGRSYMFYHNGALPGGGGFKRSACVEEFKWNEDGTIPFIPQTKEGVQPPGSIEDKEGKFWIDGSKGKLSAVLRIPDDRRPGAKYPIAVICHGFGANKCEHGGMFHDFANAFARRGVASVRFDFNGHGESEGEMLDMTVPNEVEDARRVVAWAASRPWCNGKVSIVGHSQGGVVAAMTAGSLGEKVSRVVLLAPACVLKDDVRNGCTLGSRYDPKSPPDVVKLPGGNVIGREFIKTAYDLPIFETAKKFKGPMCIVHGTGDVVAKTRHAEQFHKDHPGSELHLMEGDDHGLSHTFREVREMVAEFISRDAPFGQPLMPVVQTKYTADPAPIVRDGTVYLYTTHDEDDADGFKMFDWLLYTSTDMVNWRDCGAVASLKNFEWARNKENGAWAIQVIERGGKWYMYCPLHGNGIGVLVADSPYGPFRDPIGKPLVWQREHWNDIDPTVWIDDDGQAYMYWGNPELYCVKLNKDMVSYSGDIVKFPKIRDYQEGPWFYKRGDWYYLAFASTCCPEGIGYAMSKSAMGPWEYKGHIMDHTPKTRGNHPGIIDFKGRSYCFGLNYDILRLETSKHHERRSVSAQEMEYAPDGSIPELPYFKSGVLRQVGAFDPFRRVEAETMAWGAGLKTVPAGKGSKEFWNQVVVNVDDTEHILVKGVDFGKGARAIVASVQCLAPGASIEVRLDSKDGPLAGRIELAAADSKFAERRIALKGAKGVRDLYFVFRSREPGGKNLFTLDWWKGIK